jgi:hypothetical protein
MWVTQCHTPFGDGVKKNSKLIVVLLLVLTCYLAISQKHSSIFQHLGARVVVDVSMEWINNPTLMGYLTLFDIDLDVSGIYLMKGFLKV